MYFNSYLFVFVFFPITLFGYYIINSRERYQAAEAFLLLMSLVFYGSFEIKCVPVIIVSVLGNYIIGILLHRNSKKSLLLLGIGFNLVILIGFKYLTFIISNINKFSRSDISVPSVLIPIGLSFMTFQQISYIVDVYRDSRIKYSLLEYSLYAIFFPYVISGPIVRHNFLIPQLREKNRKSFHSESFAKGIYAFTLGLGKKVLIADTFGMVANIGFNNVADLNTTSAIFAVLSYTIQIYFDFSGYSDMVVGIGKMLNLDMPINFNSPYKAIDILDFWKRWHISLTSFLTEYVYFPLGGNRKGKMRTYLNVLCVFLISGLWHGASWMYVIWGALHGVASVINRIFKKQISKMNRVASWIILFAFLNFTWIFFRASSLNDAFMMIKKIGSCQFGALSPEMISAVLTPEIAMLIDLLFDNVAAISNIVLPMGVLLVIISMLTMRNTQEKMESFKPSTIRAILCSFILVGCIVSFSGITSFIYVNF